jgi:hypothetical protein
MAKIQDPRYAWYRKNYGERAWELDAMDPQALRNRVESYVIEYIDADAWERHKVIEAAQRNTTKMVAAKMAEMSEQT